MAIAPVSPKIQPRTPQGVFTNEPFTDFKDPENARSMREALDKIATQLGREYHLIIGGERIITPGKIRSLNPARPAQVVGIHQKAEAEHAETAMAAALRALRVLEPHLVGRARVAAAQCGRYHPQAKIRVHGLAHL